MLNARTLLVICWTSGCWAFSFGLGTQVVTHWLHAQNVSDTVIGLNHSFYYLGVALGSFALPWMNRRLGPVACVTLGLFCSGCTLAFFPWGTSEIAWYALRLLNGWAGAMTLVPLETIVSRDSPSDRKTHNFACYGVALTLGGAIGICLGLHFYRPGKTLAFYLGGSVPILTSLLLFASLKRYPAASETNEPQPALEGARNFLSYATAWCQGFLEGGMLAFLSLFLLAQGFSPDQAGVFMSITMVGVILFQVPVAWFADRWGRTATLFGCYGVVALTLLTIPSLSNTVMIAVALFCFGACSGAMYPLGLAMLGERTPPSGLARAYAWYLAIECLGSQVGAAAMGSARDRWGETSMFPVGLGAVLLVLALWLVLQFSLRRRKMTLANRPTGHEDDRQAA